MRLRLYFYDKGPFEPDLERCQRRKHILNRMNVFYCARVLKSVRFFVCIGIGTAHLPPVALINFMPIIRRSFWNNIRNSMED